MPWNKDRGKAFALAGKGKGEGGGEKKIRGKETSILEKTGGVQNPRKKQRRIGRPKKKEETCTNPPR